MGGVHAIHIPMFWDENAEILKNWSQNQSIYDNDNLVREIAIAHDFANKEVSKLKRSNNLFEPGILSESLYHSFRKS